MVLIRTLYTNLSCLFNYYNGVLVVMFMYNYCSPTHITSCYMQYFICFICDSSRCAVSVHYIESLFYFCLYNYIVTFDYLVISGCYGDVLRVKYCTTRKTQPSFSLQNLFWHKLVRVCLRCVLCVC